MSVSLSVMRVGKEPVCSVVECCTVEWRTLLYRKAITLGQVLPAITPGNDVGYVRLADDPKQVHHM